MMSTEQSAKQEEEEICLLKETLPRLDASKLAYLKGASKALLYAQDNQQELPAEENNPLTD